MHELKYSDEEVAQAEITAVSAEITEQERRCAQHLMTLLPQMRRLIGRDHEGLEYPLTMQQYAVLKGLSERSYLISELADKFKVSRPTMTRIVDGLEGRRKNSGEVETNHLDNARRPQLVERVESQTDRRLVYVRITSEGARILNCYHLKAEASAVAVLRHVPAPEMPVLEHAFEVLQQALSVSKI